MKRAGSINLPLPIAVLVIAGGIWLCFQGTRHLIGTPEVVKGSSMVPTLPPDSTLFMKPVSPTTLLLRGDIVVFDDGQGDVVKRVIGLPGDRVEFAGGKVWINGRELHEPYLKKSTVTEPQTRGRRIDVGASECLVLGDNRPVSWDGRYYGPIGFDRIKARMAVDPSEAPHLDSRPQLFALQTTRR